jgi:hypothetical protein
MGSHIRYAPSPRQAWPTIALTSISGDAALLFAQRDLEALFCQGRWGGQVFVGEGGAVACRTDATLDVPRARAREPRDSELNNLDELTP